MERREFLAGAAAIVLTTTQTTRLDAALPQLTGATISASVRVAQTLLPIKIGDIVQMVDNPGMGLMVVDAVDLDGEGAQWLHMRPPGKRPVTTDPVVFSLRNEDLLPWSAP